ncbi:unnamed protein product [Mytilus edulis]|uniref:PiggyBac transposable element-derived protein domain-containing protein n=1 Tax=Mytilus edulis TaxID=6550 RepID=A0A8S3TRU3_MYTED|nr:unnamed protein product [Mytilus edulis]
MKFVLEYMTSTGAFRNMANMANPWFRIFPPEEIAEDPEFIGESGVKNMPDRGAPAIAYFMLMFTTNLMKKIVIETNRYARSFIKTNMQRINRCRHSRVHQWIKTGPLTINEFKGFLAAIYNMGLNKRPTLQCYWKKGKQEYKWFRKMFPRNRFMINAYILYKKNSNNPRPLSRLQFIHEVVESLSMEHMRDRFPGQLENRKKELRRLANGKVKDCVVCSYRSNGRRKRSRLQCGRCLRGVHSLCFNRHLVLCDEQ